ncbi:MAG TPA: sigma-70 family RNA polymerase sigma factor, partial [Verrucomicrobiota bacterium]|nr:sigma-70 family RNA polymerase sigma factor [Verrucomicrobiota bacterium]
MTTDRALLQEYATRGSELAFRELVARYIDLVYSTAARLVNGDAHLAEDIVQTVFTDLARLARTLSPEVMLGGWLHRRACHVAWTLLRGERRRYHRERQAAEMNASEGGSDTGFEEIAPVLDEAINQLNTQDRAAIMLRFFEGRDLRSVGEAIGSSEDAAQKRVTRALTRLRDLLERRGVRASAGVLAGLLGAHAVTAAPSGLAGTVAVAAIAKAAAGSGLTLTFLKLMAMTKLKIAAGIAVAAGVGTALVLEHQALNRLREENEALQLSAAQLAREAESQPRPSENREPTQHPNALRDKQLRDLSRLRTEVGALRQQSNNLTGLRKENRELRDVTGEPDDPAEAEFEEQTKMRVEHLKQWGLSFHLYAQDHGGRFPETFEQAAGIQNSEALLGFDTNHFEIVYRGTLESV